MNNKFKNLFRITSIIVSIVMLSTGCVNNTPDGSDFKDVVYEIKLNTASSESELQDTTSEIEDTQSSVDVNSEVSSNISGKDEDVEEDNEAEDKPTDPTFYQNWKPLLNPNGFNINSNFPTVNNLLSTTIACHTFNHIVVFLSAKLHIISFSTYF